MKYERTDLKHQTACVLLLPETMDYMNLDQVSRVLVEMGDEEVNIVKVIEVPAFCDQGVAEDVSQGDSVVVGSIWEILNPSELER